MNDEETKKLILQKRDEGKVCLKTIEGLMSADVDEFIKQPAEGILYDLNRDMATTLTIMPEKRWINDIAVAMTIVALKKRIDELEAEINSLEKALHPSDLVLALKDFIIAIDDGEPEKIGHAYSGAVEALDNL